MQGIYEVYHRDGVDCYLAKKASVLIKKGDQSTASSCFEHEVPVLESIHGADNVLVLGLGEGKTFLNINKECIRLSAKYGKEYGQMFLDNFKPEPGEDGEDEMEVEPVVDESFIDELEKEEAL